MQNHIYPANAAVFDGAIWIQQLCLTYVHLLLEFSVLTERLRPAPTKSYCNGPRARNPGSYYAGPPSHENSTNSAIARPVVKLCPAW